MTLGAMSDLEGQLLAERQANAELAQQLSEATNRAVRLAQEAHDLRQDLLRAQDRAADAERRVSDLEHAAMFYVPPPTYHSIRSVERVTGQRFDLASDERIVGVSPGYNGKLIVWLASAREAPPTEEEATRTPEGERAVTEDVAR